MNKDHDDDDDDDEVDDDGGFNGDGWKGASELSPFTPSAMPTAETMLDYHSIHSNSNNSGTLSDHVKQHQESTNSVGSSTASSSQQQQRGVRKGVTTGDLSSSVTSLGGKRRQQPHGTHRMSLEEEQQNAILLAGGSAGLGTLSSLSSRLERQHQLLETRLQKRQLEKNATNDDDDDDDTSLDDNGGYKPEANHATNATRNPSINSLMSITSSLGASVNFSYKDLYGVSDEDELLLLSDYNPSNSANTNSRATVASYGDSTLHSSASSYHSGNSSTHNHNNSGTHIEVALLPASFPEREEFGNPMASDANSIGGGSMVSVNVAPKDGDDHSLTDESAEAGGGGGGRVGLNDDEESADGSDVKATATGGNNDDDDVNSIAESHATFHSLMGSVAGSMRNLLGSLDGEVQEQQQEQQVPASILGERSDDDDIISIEAYDLMDRRPLNVGQQGWESSGMVDQLSDAYESSSSEELAISPTIPGSHEELNIGKGGCRREINDAEQQPWELQSVFPQKNRTVAGNKGGTHHNGRELHASMQPDYPTETNDMQRRPWGLFQQKKTMVEGGAHRADDDMLNPLSQSFREERTRYAEHDNLNPLSQSERGSSPLLNAELPLWRRNLFRETNRATVNTGDNDGGGKSDGGDALPPTYRTVAVGDAPKRHPSGSLRSYSPTRSDEAPEGEKAAGERVSFWRRFGKSAPENQMVADSGDVESPGGSDEEGPLPLAKMLSSSKHVVQESTDGGNIETTKTDDLPPLNTKTDELMEGETACHDGEGDLSKRPGTAPPQDAERNNILPFFGRFDARKAIAHDEGSVPAHPCDVTGDHEDKSIEAKTGHGTLETAVVESTIFEKSYFNEGGDGRTISISSKSSAPSEGGEKVYSVDLNDQENAIENEIEQPAVVESTTSAIISTVGTSLNSKEEATAQNPMPPQQVEFAGGTSSRSTKMHSRSFDSLNQRSRSRESKEDASAASAPNMLRKFNDALADDDNPNGPLMVQLEALVKNQQSSKRRMLRSESYGSLLRPSLIEDFEIATYRESFQRRVSQRSFSPGRLDDSGRREAGGPVEGVDWPSPVSSLGSPLTVPKEDIEEFFELSDTDRVEGVAKSNNVDDVNSKKDLILSIQHEKDSFHDNSKCDDDLEANFARCNSDLSGGDIQTNNLPTSPTLEDAAIVSQVKCGKDEENNRNVEVNHIGDNEDELSDTKQSSQAKDVAEMDEKVSRCDLGVVYSDILGHGFAQLDDVAKSEAVNNASDKSIESKHIKEECITGERFEERTKLSGQNHLEHESDSDSGGGSIGSFSSDSPTPDDNESEKLHDSVIWGTDLPDHSAPQPIRPGLSYDSALQKTASQRQHIREMIASSSSQSGSYFSHPSRRNSTETNKSLSGSNDRLSETNGDRTLAKSATNDGPLENISTKSADDVDPVTASSYVPQSTRTRDPSFETHEHQMFEKDVSDNSAGEDKSINSADEATGDAFSYVPKRKQPESGQSDRSLGAHEIQTNHRDTTQRASIKSSELEDVFASKEEVERINAELIQNNDREMFQYNSGHSRHSFGKSSDLEDVSASEQVEIIDQELIENDYQYMDRNSMRMRNMPSRLDAASEVSSMDSFASPVFRSQFGNNDSFSSLDSLASPTHDMRVNEAQQQAAKRDVKDTKTDDIDEVVDVTFTKADDDHLEEISQAVDVADEGGMPQQNPRELTEKELSSSSRSRLLPDKASSFHSWASRGSRPHPEKKASFLLERMSSDTSMSVKDIFGDDNIDGGFEASALTDVDGFQASGLANDVALHLEHSTKSMSSYFSTDGIDHIDPRATCHEGQDDFDFAMKAYANGIKYGHFDFHDGNAAGDENTAWGGNDQVLAARAYMGLGFARQCKGELESSLDAYTKSLNLWEDEVGENHPVNASIQFAMGTVLIEMQRQLDASDHFAKALYLFKSRNPADGGIRASILSTEGMLFSVLGEAIRAIEFFRQAVLIYQSDGSMNLKFATVMFEMGSILSQHGHYDDSVNCFKFALEIRQALLGDSFVVARTHYSLGVTKASQELEANTDNASASHLEEALRICQLEFEADHLQSAIIIHALGVSNERKGDFLSASGWFAKERSMRKVLSGEDHETVASVSIDLGTCYYNSGKYDLAISTFEDGLRIILLAENDRSLEVAEALYKIASCHDSLCNYEESLEKFLEVKKIREALFGVESSPVIQTMLRIGNILLCQGEVMKALDCFSEVLGIGYASDNVNAVEVANALYGRGCAQFCGFHLADAMKSFSESLNWKLAALGEDDPGLACIFYQMAHVYLEQSETEEAITCFEEYARLQKLETQRNLHDNADICYAEGIVAKLKGRQDAALSFYQQALAMFATLFGGDHEKVASIHFDIGCVYSAMGNYKDALSHFQTCLLQRRKLLGGHVDVANALYEMASIYSQQDSVQLAVKCLTESDRIWKAKLKNNEKLTSVLVLSAKLWKSLQCYQAAEKNFEKALEHAISLYGQEHDLVSSILLSLGEFLQEINQIQQSLFCFDESIHVRTALHGADSPNVAEVEYSKGVALLFQGNFEAASNCLTRALIIRQKQLGPMDGAVGDTLNTIGFLQLRMGNISGQEALDPLTEALEIRRAIGNMAKVISTLQNIGRVYKKRKEYDSCIEIHSEILSIRQDEFGAHDLYVADAWINLADLQTSGGRLVEATVSYEEALRIRTIVNGYNHMSVAQVLFKLGSLNLRQNNYTDAKQLFEEYMRIRADEEDDPDEEMAQALTLMGDLQKETGEKSKAQINWSSAQEIYQQLDYPDSHPKLRKLRARQKASPFGWLLK